MWPLLMLTCPAIARKYIHPDTNRVRGTVQYEVQVVLTASARGEGGRVLSIEYHLITLQETCIELAGQVAALGTVVGYDTLM